MRKPGGVGTWLFIVFLTNLLLPTFGGHLLSLSLNPRGLSDSSIIKLDVVGAWDNSRGVIVVSGGTFDPEFTVKAKYYSNGWYDVCSACTLLDGQFVEYSQDSGGTQVADLLLGKGTYQCTGCNTGVDIAFRVEAASSLSRLRSAYLDTTSTYYNSPLPEETFRIYEAQLMRSTRFSGTQYSIPDDFYRVEMQRGRNDHKKIFGLTLSNPDCSSGSMYVTATESDTTWMTKKGTDSGGDIDSSNDFGTDLYLPEACYIDGLEVVCSFASSVPLDTQLPACVALDITSCGNSYAQDTYAMMCFYIVIIEYSDEVIINPPIVTNYAAGSYVVDNGITYFSAIAQTPIEFTVRSDAYSGYGVRASFTNPPGGYSVTNCDEGDNNGYSPTSQDCTVTFSYTPAVTGEYWAVTMKTWTSNLLSSDPISVIITSVNESPYITSISPTSGPTSGTTLTIYGTDLGSGITDPNWVTVGGDACTGAVYSNGALTCSVAPGTGVSLDVIVMVEGLQSNLDFLFSFNPPTYSSITATTDFSAGGAESGQVIVITGTNLGASRDDITLYIGSNLATIESAAHTYVNMLAPAGCGSSFAMTMTVGGQAATPALPSFTYSAPQVSAASTSDEIPTRGGVIMTIFGVSFCSSAVGATFSATVDGVDCPTSGVHTDTFVECTMPAGSGSASVTLSVDGGTGSRSSTTTATITYDGPAISSLEPAQLPSDGGTLTIHGSNFGASSTSSKSVSYDGGTLAVTSWDHETIVVTMVSWYARDVSIIVTTSGQPSSAYTLGIDAPVISSILPSLGSTAGGDSIVITGTSMGKSDSATTVLVGGVSATITAHTTTSITFDLPRGQGAGVVVDVTIDDYDLSTTYTYASPQVDSINPASPESPSALLTIFGSNFGISSGSSVTTSAGTCALGTGSTWSDTQIVCSRPASSGLSNTLYVTVSSQQSNTFEFDIAGPVITSWSATSYDTSGGGVLSITGTSFTTTGAVIFNSVSLSILTYSHTAITATLPAGFGTSREFYVSLSGGITSASEFYDYDPPTLTSFSCDNLGTAGGASFTLTGTSLDTGGTVTATSGTVSCSSWSHASITCTLPSGQGTYTVYITTINGLVSNSLTYAYDIPIVDSISPTTAATEGGIDVTVTGSNFGTSGTVTIGGVDCTPISSYSETQIICTLAPLTIASTLTFGHGSALVEVSGSVSDSGPTLGLAAPYIDTASPLESDTPGGGTISFTGSSFGVDGSLTVDVLIGGRDCTNLVRTHTSITCEIPEGVGTVKASVTVVGLKSNEMTLVYNPPVITSVDPQTDITIDQEITVHGSNFGVLGSVLIDQTICTLVVYDHSQVTCIMPEGAGVGHELTIVAAGITSNAIIVDYLLPNIDSIDPLTASSAGGSLMTITGAAFGITGVVTIGPYSCPAFSYTPDEIVCSIPEGIGDDLEVFVTVETGEVTNIVLFSYSPPIISNILPQNGPTEGSYITITGTSFSTSGSITVTSAYDPVFCSVSSGADFTDTQIVCLLSAGTGTVDIVVSANGFDSDVFQYTYDVPTISGVEPAFLNTDGTVPLTISGENFALTGDVTLNGASCTLTGAGRRHTRIECLCAENDGLGNTLVVSTGAETVSTTVDYETPSITSLSATEYNSDGSSFVTISGDNFGLNPTVNLGALDLVVTELTPHSQLRVELPAGSGTGSTSGVWGLQARGSEGEFGCGDSTGVGYGYGNTLSECQGLCAAYLYTAYHADTYCACFPTCNFARDPANYGSVADIYKQGHALTVTAAGLTSLASEAFSYDSPSVTSLSGCPDDYCPVLGSIPLTLAGANLAAVPVSLDKTTAELWYRLDDDSGTNLGVAAPSGTFACSGCDFTIDEWHVAARSTFAGASLDPSSYTDFTFGMWINPASPHGVVFSWDFSISTSQGMQVTLGAVGSATAGDCTAQSTCETISLSYGNGGQIFPATQAITGNTWTHIVIIRDTSANELYFYMDGALVTTISTSASIIYSGSSFAVGTGTVGQVAPDFDGILDDFIFFSSALSEDEVSALYVGSAAVPTITIDATDQNLDCPVDWTSATAILVECSLPGGTGYGLDVDLTLDSLSQSESILLDYQVPAISSISGSVVEGQTLTLTGIYLPDTGGQIILQRSGARGPIFDCPILTQSATEMTCTVPAGFGADIRVSVNDGLQWGPESTESSDYPTPVISASSLRHYPDGVIDPQGQLVGLSSSGDQITFSITNVGTIGRDVGDEEWISVVFGPSSNPEQFTCSSTLYFDTNVDAVICTIPEGFGDDLVFSVIANGIVSAPSVETYSYPAAPYVFKVEGCTNDAVLNSTVGCPTDGGGIVLTLFGSDFPSENLFVTIDGVDCPITGTIVSDKAYCVLPPGVGIELPLVVSNKNDPSTVLESLGRPLVSYLAPTVTSISGCTDSSTTTVECPRVGGTEITLVGTDLGESGALVYLCNKLCEPLVHDASSPHTQLVCTIPEGTQLDAQVIVVVGGQTASNVGLISYTQCPAGSYQFNETDLDCTPCEPGTYTDRLGEAVCTACSDGYYQADSGQVECDACAAGTFSVRESDELGATACTNCAAGSYNSLEGQGSCTDCAPGFAIDTDGQIACVACVPGKQTDSTGSLECVDCTSGRSAQLSGSISCDACPVGSYSEVGESSCHPCAVGTRNQYSGAGSCTDCAVGRYTNVEGQAACVDCDGGTYANVSGMSFCYVAQPGQIAPKAGSSGAVAPQDCGAGTYSSSAGQTSCVACTPGTNQSSAGQSYCVDCEVGRYNGDFSSTDCPICLPGKRAAYAGSESCTDCVVGKYGAVSGLGSCTNCEAGRYQDSVAQSDCISCGPGTYSQTTGQSFCRDCDVGFHVEGYDQTICLACTPGNYSSFVGAVLCTQAPEGYYITESAQPLPFPCPIGTYSTGLENTECIDCENGRYNGLSGQNTCEIAPNGTFAGVGASGPTNCQPGYYQPNEESSFCLICAAGRFSGAGADRCDPCPAGTYNSADGMALCLLCATGTYTAAADANTFCTDAAPGYYQEATGQAEEVECPLGTYNENYGQPFCSDCPVGTYTPTTASTECVPCSLGTYAPDSRSADCLNCTAGSIAAGEGQSFCSACPAGSYAANDGDSACVLCEIGRYSSVTGASDCVDCASPTYQDLEGQLSCITCAAGFVYLNTTHCEECTPGYASIAISALDCTICPAGSFTSLSGSFSCNPCPTGTYSGDGAIECIDCPAGSYTSTSSSTGCTVCPAGSYSANDGTVTCTLCAAGRYQPDENSTSCLTCTAGNYCPTGSVAQLPCVEGTYSATSSQASCAACAVGFYAPNTSTTVCTQCPVGKAAKNTGSSFCTDCAAGTYTGATGSVNCINCDVGKYANGTGNQICSNCVVGKSQPYSGRASCTDCEAGRYANVQGQQNCATCSAGYYQPDTGFSYCFPCPVGTSQATIGSVDCTDCRPGRANAANGQPSCPDCVTGKYSNVSGMEFCTDCEIGFMNDLSGQVICIECVPGRFGSATGQAQCAACPAGYYQNNTGAFECAACGPGTFQPDTAQENCTLCPSGKYYGNGTAALYCNDCPPGTYFAGEGAEECTPCPVGNYTAGFGAIICDPCETGSYSDVEEATSCDPCAPGTFMNRTGQASCDPCPLNTFGSVQGLTDCDPCGPGTHAPFEGLSLCLDCGPGTYTSTGGDCQDCPAGRAQTAAGSIECALCPNGTSNNLEGKLTCVSCNPGRYANEEGLTGCLACPNGTYQSSVGQTGCEPCGLGTALATTGAAACVSCLPGTFANVTGLQECFECGSGKYQSNISSLDCAVCPLGTASDSTGRSACPFCIPGFYADEEGLLTCKACPAGTYQNNQGGAECVPCGPGTFSTGGAAVCSPCAPGTYVSTNGSSLCDSCNIGSVQPSSGQVECDFCTQGRYMFLRGQTACVDCGTGTYVNTTNATSCLECGVGTYQPSAGSVSCLECTNGTFASAEGLIACSDCAPGSYNDLYGQAACFPCAAGYYSSDVGQSLCTPCSAGTYTSSDGQSECSSCEPGTYANDTGLQECVSCEPGLFQSQLGGGYCEQCGMGTYQSTAGATDCTGCPSGRFTTLLGQTECEPCGLGTFQLASGQTDCDACPEGMFGRYTGLDECEDCGAGKYMNETGQAECLDCPAGSAQLFSGQRGCEACDPGYYNALPGAFECTVCKDGKYQNESGAIECEACVPGKKSASGSRTECVDCSAGRYQPSPDQEDCLVCPVGTAKNTSGATECDSCVPGKYQDTQSQQECLVCPPGTVAPNVKSAACSECPAGSYMPDEGQLECNECDPGYYQDVKGQIECIICAPGKYAIGGNPECAWCGENTVATLEGQSECFVCTPGSVSNPQQTLCLCDVGSAANYSVGEEGLLETVCLECPEGSVCDSPGTEWALLEAAVGFYEGADGEFYQCLLQEHCNGDNGTCGMNRDGPLCAQCMDGYSESVDGTCELCEEGEVGISLLIFVGVVSILLLCLNYYVILKSTDSLMRASMHEEQRIREEAEEREEKINELCQKKEISRADAAATIDSNTRPKVAKDYDAPDDDGYSRFVGQLTIHGPPSPSPEFTYKLKILLGFMQILTNVSTALEIQWPQSFVEFLQTFNPANLDFIQFTNVDCLSDDVDFFFKMYAWAILTPCILISIYMFYLLPPLIRYRNGGKRNTLRINRYKREAWRLVYFTLFLVYPSTSTTILRTFVCTTVEGTSYLQADFSVVCGSDYWWSGASWALILTIIYPIGVPIFFFIPLFKAARARVLDRKMVRGELGFLYDGYRRDMWYFELLDMTHKLTLTSVLAFFPWEVQLPLAICIAAAYLIVILLTNPYIRKGDDRLHMVAQIELMCLFMSGHLLNILPPLNAVNEGLMSFLLLCMTLGFLIWFCITTWRTFQKSMHALLNSDSNPCYKLCYKSCPSCLSICERRKTKKDLNRQGAADYLSSGGISTWEARKRQKASGQFDRSREERMAEELGIPRAAADELLAPPPKKAQAVDNVQQMQKKLPKKYYRAIQNVFLGHATGEEKTSSSEGTDWLTFQQGDLLECRPTAMDGRFRGRIVRSKAISRAKTQEEGVDEETKFVHANHVEEWLS
jgi:hypothetical protein